ncbi:RILP-like protein 1 isoform X2 [Pseudochaenichthys georgianus]|uniref:RILP-like protein 1 isoform X2 n=1 Tax=Pseudochaenichthys georgianus TaxID=52239 RepID=UPI00146E1EE8|nr:RILP-like protein 1 isoform X2 [Pseudochaenichthys georgianus]
METCGIMSALDRPAAELTVMDVYDIAAVLGQEFERIIDRFGCESLVGLVPKVVRVLELLEAQVSSGAAGQEADELRGELDRLRRARSDRSEQERKQQKELEQVEDVWRGEVQDLLSQIRQLQAENKTLLVSLSLKDCPPAEEDLQKQDGMSEKERQVMNKLKDSVDKQRDELRAKDHELTLKNEDVEALQTQQHRLIRTNQDLRHRIGVREAQGKALIQQRAELEGEAQARQQELGALQLEVSRLRKELQGWELEREIPDIKESSLTISESSPPKPPAITPSTADSLKPKSVWVECGGDPGFLANCFEREKSPSVRRRSSKRENNEEEDDEEEETTALSLKVSADTKPKEESDSLETDTPRFTLQELRDVLQEKNQLKAQVFILQEELAYYKSEEFEDDISSIECPPSPPPWSTSTDQVESGIRRLIFTAIMPMVAAGLIAEDPTSLPIRRLYFV